MLLGIGPEGPVAGRRVAITGLGVVSCCGIGADALWNGLNGPPPVGERRVPGFDPEQWLSSKEARPLDADPGRSAVIMGTGVGGLQTLETQIAVYVEKGARRVSPRLVPMMMCNAGAAAVSSWTWISSIWTRGVVQVGYEAVTR